MSGPLTGFTLLDLTQGLCGPFAAARLGDSGMDVIKVEPLGGDASRQMAPPFVAGESATFLGVNRNKRSVAVNLDSPEGIKIVRDLMEKADVVLEDWGPGIAAQRSLDYSEIRRARPGLVWCSITPFGEEGPMRDQPGSELVVQAMSDYPNSLGFKNEEPVRVGTDIANLNTAIMASQAVAAALFDRLRTGEGQRVAVNQLGSLLHVRGLMWTSMSEPDDWFGLFCDNYTRVPDHGYQTATDPVYWGLRRGDSEDWDRLLIELDMLEQADDPRFADYGRQATSIGRYGPEVKPIWEEAFKRKGMTREDVIELILSVKGDAVPFADYPTLLDHPQLKELGMFREMDHPTAGRVRTLRPGWTFSRTPADIRRPPPLLGEHTDELLEALGIGADERERMRKNGWVL
ncbi:MAG: CoA transferase [Burkholderiaceae bacterium]|nr:CoA transferase [Burkholderiaceae bacterium]